jgi:serine/threonine protein kinase
VLELVAGDQDGSRLYAVLEWAAGGSLRELLARRARDGGGGVGEAATRYYAASVALGLGALHACGYALVGLEARHVLLRADGRARLGGLGRARPLARVDDGGGARDAEADAPDVPLAQRPPELLAAGSKGLGGWGAAADWWSLGLLAHELLGAAHPFCDAPRLSLLPPALADSTLRACIAELVYVPPAELGEDGASCLAELLRKQVGRLRGLARARVSDGATTRDARIALRPCFHHCAPRHDLVASARSRDHLFSRSIASARRSPTQRTCSRTRGLRR